MSSISEPNTTKSWSIPVSSARRSSARFILIIFFIVTQTTSLPAKSLTINDFRGQLADMARAARKDDAVALQKSLAKLERFYGIVVRQSTPVERLDLTLSFGQIYHSAAEKNEMPKTKRRLQAEALAYFERAAEIALALNRHNDRKTAIDSAVLLYRELHGVETDGMQDYGDQQALVGLIPLLEAARQSMAFLHGDRDASVGVISLNLAHLKMSTKADEASIPDYRIALAIFNETKAGDSGIPADVQDSMGRYIWSAALGLYEALMGRFRHDEATAVIQLLLQTFPEDKTPEDHAEALNRLGMHYFYVGENGRAVEQLERAASAVGRLPDPSERFLAVIQDNLAMVYLRLGQYDKALARNREAYRLLITAVAKEGGSGFDTDITKIQNNYGAILEYKGDYKLAVEVYQGVLTEKLKEEGRECLSCGIQHFNIARALLEQNRKQPNPEILKTALWHAQTSLDTNLKFVGRQIAQTAVAFEQLAEIEIDAGKTSEAAEHSGEAIVIYKDLFAKSGISRSDYIEACRNANLIRLRALSRTAPSSDISLEPSFEAAQIIAWSRTAEAFTQFAERIDQNNPKLTELLRHRQDLVKQRAAVVTRLENETIDIAKGSEKSAARLAESRRQVQGLDSALLTNGDSIAREAPEFADATLPRTLNVSSVSKLLPQKSLLLFVVSEAKATYVWAIDDQDARWKRVNVTNEQLQQMVAALRQGLDVADQGNWWRMDFDTALAFKLYQLVLGPVAEMIDRNQRLIVIASGALTSLPLQVLVSRDPGGERDYRRINWLIRDHSILVLPSIIALGFQSRQIKKETSPRYAGFGAPALEGPPSRAYSITKDAWEGIKSMIRGAGVDVAKLRQLPPLPDTSRELTTVADRLGIARDMVHTGARATEASFRQLPLANLNILHFATHALVPGEVGANEPGLVLTPPTEESKDDNGYISMSEVMDLRLNADWVILSACNTASGDTGNGEALSGLARAFFYAGSRSLLVSHWRVRSDAAADLIIDTVARGSRDTVTAADALREAMLKFVDVKASSDRSHPSIWAPFILVGASGVSFVGSSAAHQ